MASPKKARAKGGSKPMGLADLPMAATAMPAREDAKQRRRYEAEDALRTLTRADEHRSNKRLMSDVKKLAAEHAAKMARIARK